MRLWRLSRFPSARKAFDGEGSRRCPGRWNTAETPLVYASASLSLAALEVLVHAEIDLAGLAIGGPEPFSFDPRFRKGPRARQ